ncbi:MAG: serine/threonine protein kinase, partial [Myxococcales bacterium]|nr:serine/threonine protein kinase [Myxococcales bacterium]
RAVECVLQACHAIAEAHMLGIIHRDLKPGNLFLTRRTDGSPCIKVLDFGISKVTHQLDGLDEPSLVTKTTAIMGSPFYMSPEQMLASRNVDARSDIWALGVVLYELLTKTLPFAADSVQGVCARILGDAPTPLGKLRPQYPKGLEDILTRCLTRKPEQRFANIADFAARLGEFGPPHTRYAVDSIFELIKPSDPSTQPHLLESPAPSSGGTTDVTLYVPAGKATTGLGWGAGSAAIAVTFGAGLGLGWLFSVPTDPTHSAGFVSPAATPSPANRAMGPDAMESGAAMQPEAPVQVASATSVLSEESLPAAPAGEGAELIDDAEGGAANAPPAIDLDADTGERGVSARRSERVRGADARGTAKATVSPRPSAQSVASPTLATSSSAAAASATAAAATIATAKPTANPAGPRATDIVF